MQLKYFLEEQNKVNELYLKKFPQERTELNIKLSILSEITEFINACGFSHKEVESVERQKSELLDIFMFALEYCNTHDNYIQHNVEVQFSMLRKNNNKEKLINEILKIVRLSITETYNILDSYMILVKIIEIFSCCFNVGFDEFKELFDKKIKENLERFK
ncbi:MAG: hypothetical protein ACRC7W_01685 [Fusobacteriaceae bacterium]